MKNLLTSIIASTIAGVLVLWLSLSIAPGEAVALMGGNGAGKSTLVSILAGLMRPDEGSLLVDGRERHFHKPQDSRDLGIERFLCHGPGGAQSI